jgi:hypothetical protein
MNRKTRRALAKLCSRTVFVNLSNFRSLKQKLNYYEGSHAERFDVWLSRLRKRCGLEEI